jgi:hypothetical protein
MAWTEQTATSVNYDLKAEGETVWDSGATVWDVSGNVETTNWDDPTTSYTEQTGTSVTWTEV